MKTKTVYAISDNPAATVELSHAAAALGERAVVLCCTEGLFLNAVSAIADAIAEAKPDMVLTLSSRNGRLAAGMAAAKLRAMVLSDPSELEFGADSVEACRLVYGGSAVRRERVKYGSAVICASPGILPQSEDEAETIGFSGVDGAVTLVEKRSKEVQSIDLGAAAHVVCAGRGVKDEAVLADLYKVTELMDAELACTRPVAEENQWMPRERYVGVSGAMIKPEVYLAVGVSGQMQHMVGCNQSGLIFAINKDKDALIFKNCDYGIVGDAAAILPALAEKLK